MHALFKPKCDQCCGHVARIMDTGVARTTKVVLPYWVPALCRVFVKAGKIVCALSFSEACLLSGVYKAHYLPFIIIGCKLTKFCY